MSVIARIELAAAFLAGACSAAYDGAVATSSAENGPTLYAVAEELVVRRRASLAVDTAFQRQGIGRELLRRTHAAAGPQTKLILLAAPKAVTYYPHIGMQRPASCWIRDAVHE